ncbi:MAG: hypothetical protein ACXVB4_09740 [Pseudobdellovibrionaceae bacterium]
MKKALTLFVTLTSCLAFAQTASESTTSYDLAIEGKQAKTQYVLLQNDPLAKASNLNGYQTLSVRTKDGSWLSCTDWQNNGGVQCSAKINGIVSQ